jgi:hypothetical protein
VNAVRKRNADAAASMVAGVIRRRARQGFEISLERSFDPKAGKVDVFPQEITRGLLNLISNGFYATTKKRTVEMNGPYEPTLCAATRDLGHGVEIRIRKRLSGPELWQQRPRAWPIEAASRATTERFSRR